MASRFQFALPDPRSRDGWFRVGNVDVTTTALLVALGVASMFLYAISKTAFLKLVFYPAAVRDGDIWRVATWPIANPPTQIWVVLTLLFFWIIGHAVEDLVGRVRFSVLAAVITIVPAVFVTLLPTAQFPTTIEIGLGTLGTAMLAVFAAEHPNTPFFFGVPAWIITIVFVTLDVLILVADRVWGTLVLLLLAIALALLIVRQWGFATKLQWIPKFSGGTAHPPRRGPAPRRSTSRSSGRSSDRGRVVEGPWSAPSPPRSDQDASSAQVELDALLDKISAGGLDSLSADEKRRLNELSKRLR